MSVHIGFLGIAHMHSYGYAEACRKVDDAEFVGVWDEDGQRAGRFISARRGLTYKTPEALLNDVDAVIITSENKKHAEYAEMAARAGKHILCEKPLVTSEEEASRMMTAVEAAGVKLMTAFPCRYSPTFERLRERVKAGDIGNVVAVCATNRGRSPFDWFVEEDKSGGGAMIDHTVHVADLLRALLGVEVVRVQAQTGNNMYGKSWEDTAMLTLEFSNGIFATLDSSWSRPQGYKTWGDVTMNVVGENGVIEMDMFGQSLDVHMDGKPHSVAWWGSDLDRRLVGDFVECIKNNAEPPVTAFDGLQAARVAMAGYRSAAELRVVDTPAA
jgi:predicted dehydrogenase